MYIVLEFTVYAILIKIIKRATNYIMYKLYNTSIRAFPFVAASASFSCSREESYISNWDYIYIILNEG